MAVPLHEAATGTLPSDRDVVGDAKPGQDEIMIEA
jgi:hypothetical protein